MKQIIYILLSGFVVLGSQPSLAQDFVYQFAEQEERRINRLIEIDHNGDSSLLDLTVRELVELKCHVTANGKWLKCDWPYTPKQCEQIGWVPHHDGSCCKQIGFEGPPGLAVE